MMVFSWYNCVVLGLVLYWSHLVATKDPLCDGSRTIPTGKCCPRDYAPYCCSGIPVCSDEQNNTVNVKHVIIEPGCDAPWNLSACFEGFYSPDGKTTLPCPPGFFCEENEVCIKPCPVGAYCIQNKLQVGNCSGFEKCCSPSNLPPVYDEFTNRLICAGQFYPARCLGGSYCPNTTTMLRCPSGHFCREGSNKPIKCPTLSASCGEGETSANTLISGLIINACLLFIFLVTILSFNHRHYLKFHFNLYKKRILKTRTLSQKYNISDGIFMAITRLPDLSEAATDLEFKPKERTYDIDFENLSLKLPSGVNKGKVLLQGVTGELHAGEVTAVLGPSGAGKTTFLNVLCGKAYYGETGGTVRINGIKVDSFQNYKILTGFVPQDDIMHRFLTVGEVLYYNALLRLPPQTDPKYHAKMVKKVLNLLGIRQIANSQIGDEETRGISGGQRRRVNIGMELVTDPSILFLDEPTTGLDSSSSLAVVKALNTLASKVKMTVMCVIHQPRYEILKMFDKVLFLGRGGRTVYSGTVENAETYFASFGFPLPPFMNPADFYMDVIAGSVKCQSNVYNDLYEEWHRYRTEVETVGDVNVKSLSKPLQAWVDKSISEDISPATNPAHSCQDHHGKWRRVGPGFFAQLWIFLKREFVLQLHMAKTLVLDQALLLLAGSVLGLLFREVEIQSVAESNIFGNIGVGLVAVVGALRSFGINRVVFWRESASGINRLSYFFAVNLAYIPILLISPAVYLSIFYSLAAFLAPFSRHYLVFLCAWFYLSGLGYTISLMMTPRNSQMATIISVVIMAMLSGGTADLCKMDETYIGTAIYNLSFSRWVAEAIFEIEAKESSDVLIDAISEFQNGNHYDLDSYSTSLIALVVIGLGLRIIALGLLLFTKRGQQK